MSKNTGEFIMAPIFKDQGVKTILFTEESPLYDGSSNCVYRMDLEDHNLRCDISPGTGATGTVILPCPAQASGLYNITVRAGATKTVLLENNKGDTIVTCNKADTQVLLVPDGKTWRVLVKLETTP